MKKNSYQNEVSRFANLTNKQINSNYIGNNQIKLSNGNGFTTSNNDTVFKQNVSNVFTYTTASGADKFINSSIISSNYTEIKQGLPSFKTIVNVPYSCINKKEYMMANIKLIEEIAQKMNGLSYNINYDMKLKAEFNGVIAQGTKDCKILGEMYIEEAQKNSKATRDVREKWIELGNKYLAPEYTIYDYLQENGIAIPMQEDEVMIQQLQAQLAQLQLQLNQNNNTIQQQANTIQQQANDLLQSNNIITDRNNTIQQQANDLLQSNNIITDRNNTIQQQQHDNQILVDANIDLTTRLTTSEEKNAIIQEKFELSEAKVAPLQEKILDLKHYNEKLEKYNDELKTDKIELRDYNKMLIDDKKMLQEEKKLLLVDKKHFQDLNLEQTLKIAELSKIHCNDPNHLELIGNEMNLLSNELE